MWGHIGHSNIWEGEGASSSEWGRVAMRFFITSRTSTTKIIISPTSDSGMLGTEIWMSHMIVLWLQQHS